MRDKGMRCQWQCLGCRSICDGLAVVPAIPLCLPHIQVGETVRELLGHSRIPRDLMRIILGYFLPSVHSVLDLPSLANIEITRRFLLHRHSCASKGHCHGPVAYCYPPISVARRRMGINWMSPHLLAE